jgi:hypothetical protein
MATTSLSVNLVDEPGAEMIPRIPHMRLTSSFAAAEFNGVTKDPVKAKVTREIQDLPAPRCDPLAQKNTAANNARRSVSTAV